jgi:hypothetical protein
LHSFALPTQTHIAQHQYDNHFRTFSCHFTSAFSIYAQQQIWHSLGPTLIILRKVPEKRGRTKDSNAGNCNPKFWERRSIPINALYKLFWMQFSFSWHDEDFLCHASINFVQLRFYQALSCWIKFILVNEWTWINLG